MFMTRTLKRSARRKYLRDTGWIPWGDRMYRRGGKNYGITNAEHKRTKGNKR